MVSPSASAVVPLYLCKQEKIGVFLPQSRHLLPEVCVLCHQRIISQGDIVCLLHRTLQLLVKGFLSTAPCHTRKKKKKKKKRRKKKRRRRRMRCDFVALPVSQLMHTKDTTHSCCTPLFDLCTPPSTLSHMTWGCYVLRNSSLELRDDGRSGSREDRKVARSSG